MQWRWVVGFEGLYAVSDTGMVWSSQSNKIMAQVPDEKSGYLCVRTTVDGKRTRVYPHRAVLEAFIGPAEGRWSLHRDDNPFNNVLSNLYWGTQADNIEDMRRNGISTGVRKTVCSREHLLVEPNLHFSTSNGREVKACKACRIARQRARFQDLDLQAEADKIYAQMGVI